MMLVSMVENVGIAETFLSIATAIILMCYPVIPNQGSGVIYPGSRELARQIHRGWTHNGGHFVRWAIQTLVMGMTWKCHFRFLI